MVLRMGGVTVVGAADAVLETPEGRSIPPEDQAKALVGGAGPVLRIARHRAVKAGRVRLRHLTDLANALFSAMGNDLEPWIFFHRFFQLIEIFDHTLSNAPSSCAFFIVDELLTAVDDAELRPEQIVCFSLLSLPDHR